MNHPRRQMEDIDVQQELSPPPQALHMPQRKGSDNVLCLGLLDSMSSHHQQTSLSTGSPIGLDIDSEEEEYDERNNFRRSSSNNNNINKCECGDQHNNTYNLSPPKRRDLPWEPQKPKQEEFYNDESSADGDGDVEEPLNDCSCGQSEPGGQEKEVDRPPRTPQHEHEDPSSSSFDDMMHDMMEGFHIVDLKWQTDCLNSPLKDGSNATGDDPPTYPTHPTTRYGDDDDDDEEDTTYREGEEEEIPLRSCDGGGASGSKSGNNRAYRNRPGCITTRPPSISNSVSSNMSSPQPYYAKQANIGTGTSVVSGASCGCGGRVACEDGSTAQESQSTTFLLTEERVRAFMVDYYDDFDSIGQSSECLETFFHHYCTPEIRWMRPSGNPIDLDGLVRLFTEDMQVEKYLLVSVDSIQVLAGGLAAIVTVTADQIFRYRGTPNSDRAVISHVLEVVNNGREIKIVHEHRTTGRPIPKETRWSTTES